MKNIPKFLLLAGTLALAGCGSLIPKAEKDPAHYYVLNVAPTGKTPAGDLRPGIALTISRVQIPSYLDRSEILLRASPNRIEISENNLWLEPLGKACTRVFSQNLANKLGTERLALEPMLDIYRDAVQVQVSILKFDGELGKAVAMRARWRVSNYIDGITLAAGEDEFETVPADNSYESYVESMSVSLNKLSEKIASEIRKHPAPQPQSETK